jgi:segregation and condensation protein A
MHKLDIAQSRAIDDSVISHLLFHKSLIDEEYGAERINSYIDLLQQTHEGLHISCTDPFDRSIAIAFELVINQHLNPWDLDLVTFSTMYLEKARKEQIDLITAGRIILMAWKILKLQSEDLVIHLQEEEKQVQEDLEWAGFMDDAWLTTDDEYSYTNLLMNVPDPPLEEPVRRQTKRKVTLMELLDAFDLARKESEEFQRNEKQRQAERQRLIESSRKRMKGSAHEDNLEADVEEIWHRIQTYGTGQLKLSDLCDINDRDDVIKTLISVLFLSYEQKVVVYQKRFPYGKIFIQTLGCT